MSLEQAFLDRITAEPENSLHRLIYADWLEEQGDPRAELLRIQEQLRTLDVPDRPRVEARMHELINQGVQPLTITRTNSIGMKLVLIFPGQFLMGPRPGELSLPEEDQVVVTLTKAFWMGQFPVTQEEYGKSGKAGRQYPSSFNQRVLQRDTLQNPVESVTWLESMAFCEFLTISARQRGYITNDWTYILPTEAQWEYACRAGTTTRYSFGNNEKFLTEYAWFFENSMDYNLQQRVSHHVGIKKQNPWNLYDMHGNILERCQDDYQEKLRGGEDPAEIASGSKQCVARGGHYALNPIACGSADRFHVSHGVHSRHVGFRVALVRAD